MYTTYTGSRVRLRPIADLAEWDRLGLQGLEDPGTFWGPWYEPLGGGHEEFHGSGGLDLEEGLRWAIEDVVSGALVGEECLYLERLGGWLGTYIYPKFRQRGYGIEAKQLAACAAFENLPLTMLYAVTLAGHSAAIRGLQLSGMQYLGCRPVSNYSAGSHVQKVYYSQSREAWLATDYRHRVQRS